MKEKKNQMESPLAGTQRTDFESGREQRGDAFVVDWHLSDLDRAMGEASLAALKAQKTHKCGTSKISNFEFPWGGAASVLVVLLVAAVIGWVGWEVIQGLAHLKLLFAQAAG
jgi:hypothetical protein